MKLDQIGLPVAAMYGVSSAGGIFGGWFYSRLTEHGRGNNAARKLAMLACALMVLPIVLAPRVSSAVGFVLQATGSYLTIFALASFSYLVGLGIIQLMSPRLLAVNLEVRDT